jgi:anti-sigma factor RsiW
MNEHTELLPQLAAYHDGELNAADTKTIESHLAGCAHCRRLLQDFEALDSAVLDLEQPELEDRGIYLRALADIREAQDGVHRSVWGSRWIVRSVAAAALLLFGLSTQYFWEQARPQVAVIAPASEEPTDQESPILQNQTATAGTLALENPSPDAPALTPAEKAQPNLPDDPEVAETGSRVLAEVPNVTEPVNISTAPKSLKFGDSGIPQESDRLARLLDILTADTHFRALASNDDDYFSSSVLDIVEINLMPQFEAEFVGIRYAIGDLLSDQHEIQAISPVQLSPEQSYLVLNLRLEQTALTTRTSNQVTSEAAAVRMADITWRLATITADRQDVHVAIRAQTAAMRKQPALTARSISRLATLNGMIQ